jgi:hypothetical protein
MVIVGHSDSLVHSFGFWSEMMDIAPHVIAMVDSELGKMFPVVQAEINRGLRDLLEPARNGDPFSLEVDDDSLCDMVGDAMEKLTDAVFKALEEQGVVRI